MEDENVVENEVIEEVVESHIDDEIEVETSDWEPNYTFDVKGETMEFDEELRLGVTTREAEEKLRDLYTKAVGLDGVKERLSTFEGNNKELNETLGLMTKGYESLKSSVDGNNIESLLKSLGVNGNEQFEDAILEWAVKKADFLTLPEEEQNQIKNKNSRDIELESLRNEISSIKSQSSQASVNAELGRMRDMISSDKWNNLNSSLKDVGISLEDEAISIGINQFRTTGTEPTIEQAIEMASKKYALFINKNNNVSNVSEENTVISNTLPRVKRSSKSAMATSIRSIDDLKNLAASMGI